MENSIKNSVNVVIPTFNRESIIGDAIEAALAQDHENLVVTVVDDGSSDQTTEAVAGYLPHPRFRCISLMHNVGTAQAKNVAIALNDCEFITFHDSDDFPHRDKISTQVAVAANPEIEAHPILNWRLSGKEPGSRLDVDLVVSEHTLVCADGTRHHIRRALSLVDDVFPNLQMAAGVPGDWILINCGLFRSSVFQDIGGFSNSIEEDRELRNRLIFDGRVLWLVPQILLTKYECEDSLTIQGSTNYDSKRRSQDRASIWSDAGAFRQGKSIDPVVMDLSKVRFRYLSDNLQKSNALMTPESRRNLDREISRARMAGRGIPCSA